MGLSDFSEFVKVLAGNIRRARLRLQYRQVDVAAKVGMNYRHYQNLESGSVNPKMETIHRLAGLFGHSVSDLTAQGMSPFEFPGSLLVENRPQLQMLDSLNVGAGVLNQEGKLIYLNTALATMFELPMHQALGRSPAEWFAPEDRSRYLDNVAKRKQGRPEPYFCELRQANGERRLIFVHVQTYLTPSGGFEGSLALMFDVTKAFNERFVALGGQALTSTPAPVT